MSDIRPCPWEVWARDGYCGDCSVCRARGTMAGNPLGWKTSALASASATELADAVCLLADKAAKDAGPAEKQLIKMWRTQAEGGIAEIGRIIKERGEG